MPSSSKADQLQRAPTTATAAIRGRTKYGGNAEIEAEQERHDGGIGHRNRLGHIDRSRRCAPVWSQTTATPIRLAALTRSIT